MSITVRFACGHAHVVPDTAEAPICPICQEHRVSRVDAPPPKFSGFCSSPLKGSDA